MRTRRLTLGNLAAYRGLASQLVSRLAPWLALAACVAVITAGCSGGSRDNPDLAVLRAQRIATEPIPGTADGSTQEVAGGTALGKPVHAVLSRLLRLQAGSDQQSVLAAAVAAAERDGWVVESPPAEGGAWLLRKTDRATRLKLGVSVQTVDGTPTLVMNLMNVGAVA